MDMLGQSNMEMTMKGNMGQPIDHSLETLLNAGNYRDRIRFITVPRTKGVKERADFRRSKMGSFFARNNDGL